MVRENGYTVRGSNSAIFISANFSNSGQFASTGAISLKPPLEGLHPDNGSCSPCKIEVTRTVGESDYTPA